MAFLIVIFYTTQKPPYSYEVELKDGSIEESFDCYEKDEKKICEIDLEKKGRSELLEDREIEREAYDKKGKR